MKYWTASDYSLFVSTNRALLQRVFYSFALFCLVLNFLQGTLISQIGQNPLLNQDVDPVYLLFMTMQIPQTISGTVAPYFESLLFLACIASIVWPKQNISPLAFLFFYFIFFVVYNMLSGHHYTNVGLLMMSIPFIFISHARFGYAFNICRFFLCFMMFSAACWKIARGNLWHLDQTGALLISSHVEALASNAHSIPMSILKWLIQHRYMAHSIWIILILLEGLFVLGFISYKWDKLLFVSYILFFIGGWVLFNIYNFENLLLLLTLTPVLGFIHFLKRAFFEKQRLEANSVLE